MKQKLFGRISKDNILELCFLTQGDKNDHRKEEFYRLTFDEDNRVAFNALHVLSNFDLANNSINTIIKISAKKAKIEYVINSNIISIFNVILLFNYLS